MRTKVLCAAALAAGALTSMAQVYSANIVGYVNKAAPVGYSFMSNPLDNGANTATIVFPNVNPDPTGNSGQYGPWDGSSIQEWTGVSWKVSYFDSLTDDTSTGFTDAFGAAAVPPTLGSGKGFLLNNQSPGGAATVTFVGNVRTGTNTLALPVASRPYALGSMLPVTGGISSTVGFANVNPDPTGNSGQYGPLDGCLIEFLKTTPGGGAAGYSVAYFDSLTDDTSTGFTDPFGAAVPEPQIGLGQGFFFVNASPAGTYNFQQILNP